MGILVKGAKALEGGVKGAPKIAKGVVKKHPVASAATAGYVVGATHSSYAHTHPEFYDSTPNKGRSADKHPYGGYYGQ